MDEPFHDTAIISIPGSFLRFRSLHHGRIKPRRDQFTGCYTDTWLSVTQTIFHDLFALGDGQLSWIGKLGLEDAIVDEFTSDWIDIACSP